MHSLTFRRGAAAEALFWLAAVAALAALDPRADSWFTICPFHWAGQAIGIDFCPGCGLGRAVGLLFRREFAASVAMHPLGIPAVLVLVAHSARLLVSAYASTRIRVLPPVPRAA